MVHKREQGTEQSLSHIYALGPKKKKCFLALGDWGNHVTMLTPDSGEPSDSGVTLVIEPKLLFNTKLWSVLV